MKKWIGRAVLAVVVLIVLAVVIVFLALNSIVRSAIQTQATASLNVPTTLDSADVSPFGGTVQLTGLNVGSPPNYTAPHLLTLGGLKIAVTYSQMTGNPIRINKIEIDNPQLVVEQANGKLNLQALMDQSPSSSSSTPAPSSSSSQPMKLIIDELDVNNAQVSLLAGLPGLSNPMNVTVPSLTLKNIGNSDNAQNGAAIKDVVMQVATALAGKAGQSAGLSKLLNSQLAQLAPQLGQSFSSQFQDAVGSAGGGLGNTLKGAGQGISQGLSGLLNSGGKNSQ
ncbi:MAG: hypothetical protein ABSF29_13340 [Tepidisphaeraceae bacterium]|jgi:hypothetical protein